ncbi:MAG TPA: PAS domain S-box protein [Stellaceae bacterium]|nr:PAS domain S-box protein [Stellaceae bacterium]
MGEVPATWGAAVAATDFEAVAAIAARLLAAPAGRVWLAPERGAPAAPLYAHALAADGAVVVADAASDPALTADPDVASGRVRFFAAAPILARDGTRRGVLAVSDPTPRPGFGANEARVLEVLAWLAAAELERRDVRLRLDETEVARTLAEARLALANEITQAALAAPDFKSALALCLRLAAAHVGADLAFARGLAPRSGMLQVEASYTAPDAYELEPLRDYFLTTPVSRDNSIVAATIFDRRPLVLRDLAGLDAQRYPLLDAVRKHGVRSLLSVPCESHGSRYSLTFLFRREPPDIDAAADTVTALSSRVRDLLARKQSEERIALLQSVVLHTGDAVVVAEMLEGGGDLPRVVYVNPAFTALTGYAADEVMGRLPTILRGSKSEPASLERMRVAIDRSEALHVEMYLHRKDGVPFWAEIDLTPIEVGSAPASHWIAVMRDRTERRASEEAQRNSERALRRLAERQTAVIDALPAHVCLIDVDGRIVSVSRSWAEFAHACGVADSGAGDSYFAFLEQCCLPEYRVAMTEGVATVLAGQSVEFSTDYTCRRPDGWQRWYRLMIAPMAPRHGQGAVAMHLDVTSNKLAEEALRREKEFSDFLIKSTTEGILVFDRAFEITLWNPGIEAITGIAPDLALGRRAFEVLPFIAGTPCELAMRGALEGQEASFFDQRYALPATGRNGFYEAYFAPLMSSGQVIVGGIGFLRETTERRRIEDALRQAQKMEAVGQLTGGIAHDFNNMLTVIAGNLELLESKLTSEPRLSRLVTSAALAASRAEKLTQQLLTFSRRQQLRPQPVDLNQIIIGLDDLLHRTVGETIEIRSSLAPDIWPAMADPNQLETALLNLVLNARDAIASGGRITLETANVEIARGNAQMALGAYAMLSITDTGSGMSEHVLAHVFEPFFTTKEIGKGTGLGLAQVYGFINQSQGHVRIDSKEGQGTTVRLYLPRAEGAAGAGLSSQAREQPYRGSETVLVVEDDHGVRDFAASVLRELGYRVLEASSGDSALQLLERIEAIDLLFTDVVMPGRLNGVDLAREALDRRADLRVLFTSGYTTRLVEKGWPAEDVELLRKPYRSVDLAERVRTVLDQPVGAAN